MPRAGLVAALSLKAGVSARAKGGPQEGGGSEPKGPGDDLSSWALGRFGFGRRAGDDGWLGLGARGAETGRAGGPGSSRPGLARAAGARPNSGSGQARPATFASQLDKDLR